MTENQPNPNPQKRTVTEVQNNPTRAEFRPPPKPIKAGTPGVTPSFPAGQRPALAQSREERRQILRDASRERRDIWKAERQAVVDSQRQERNERRSQETRVRPTDPGARIFPRSQEGTSTTTPRRVEVPLANREQIEYGLSRRQQNIERVKRLLDPGRGREDLNRDINPVSPDLRDTDIETVGDINIPQMEDDPIVRDLESPDEVRRSLEETVGDINIPQMEDDPIVRDLETTDTIEDEPEDINKGELLNRLQEGNITREEASKLNDILYGELEESNRRLNELREEGRRLNNEIRDYRRDTPEYRELREKIRVLQSEQTEVFERVFDINTNRLIIERRLRGDN